MAKDKYRHEWERQERQSAEERVVMGAVAAAAEFEAENKAEKTAETAKADSNAETTGDERNGATQAEIGALNDRLKRTLAEFEDFRRRSEREKAQMSDLGVKSMPKKFLPVIDNFERSVAQVPESEDSGTKVYIEDMDVIYYQLLKNLKEMGVGAVDTKGKPFDPAYHNAVMHEDDEALDENVVSEELQKGYLYKDSVLRHSMAKIANQIGV